MGCQQSHAVAEHRRPSAASSADELSYFSTTNILRAALVAAVDTCDAALTHAILTKKPQFITHHIRDVSLVIATCTDARHEVLRVLLRHGANADDGLETDGISALHVAVMANQVRAVDVLMEHGASVNAPMRTPGQPFDGMTPLHLAARQGFVDVAQALVATGKIDATAVDASGFTPIQLAVMRPVGFPVFTLLHSLGLVPTLVGPTSGCDVPLVVLAIRPDNLPTIQYLLKHGAENHIVDDATRGTGVTPLMTASADGLDDVVEVLLAHDANVNAVRTTEPVNATALFEAAYHGHDAIVAILLQAGARHYVLAGETGMTPLHAAASQGHVACIEALCGAGADVNRPSCHRKPSANRGDDELTPLHVTALQGFVEAADLLLQRGAIVDAKTAHGNTPLLLAVKHGHSEFVSHVLDRYDVDIHHRDADGANALDVAVALGDADMTRVLLVHGMDATAVCRATNLTPLQVAEVRGWHDVAAVLTDKSSAVAVAKGA